MKFILAEKKEMTQKFRENGEAVPVTRVVAGPCTVVQIKGKDKDGYDAVQIGFGLKKKLSKPLSGHVGSLGNFRYLKEFRLDENVALEKGVKITAKTFVEGEKVKVTGIAKGRGFQGVVKRHGFHGSPATHGHKDQLRMPGSIGAGGVQHVFKGRRMGGHMGDNQVTVANLEIVEVNPETNELFIKGAIPGAINNLILITADGELMTEKEVTTPVAETQADVPAETEPITEETAASTEKAEESSTPETVKEEAAPEAEPVKVGEEQAK